LDQAEQTKPGRVGDYFQRRGELPGVVSLERLL
jgi:hypothetical protein